MSNSPRTLKPSLGIGANPSPRPNDQPMSLMSSAPSRSILYEPIPANGKMSNEGLPKVKRTLAPYEVRSPPSRVYVVLPKVSSTSPSDEDPYQGSTVNIEESL